MTNAAPPRRRKPRATQSKPVELVEAEDSTVVPYDEDLLERARTQWQFGDWESLARLDRETLQHHPDRAKLALLAAAGQLQCGNSAEARRSIRVASDWGCNKGLISRMLIAGVHNSLGRFSALSGRDDAALSHFRRSLSIGMPGAEARLLTQARVSHQLVLLGSTEGGEKESVPEGDNEAGARHQVHAAQFEPALAYEGLFQLDVTLPAGITKRVSFNPNGPHVVSVESDKLAFDVPEGQALYLCSSPDGNFNIPPPIVQFGLRASAPYVLSGEISVQGIAPVFWVFEYDQRKRIASCNEKAVSNRFVLSLTTHPSHLNLSLAIRLNGKGVLDLANTRFKIECQSDEALLLQKRMDQSLKVVTQQLESFLEVQSFIATGKKAPIMHGWPISPDIAKYMIDRLQSVQYDLIVEFGSGTSTQLFARAMSQQRLHSGNSLPSSALQNYPETQPRVLALEHLEKYHALTLQQLQTAGLSDLVRLELSPLQPYIAPDGAQYKYYDCQKVLQELASHISVKNACIFVFVDGPPEATGKLARYPALLHILACFSGARIDILMDDYIRADEKEIVQRWSQELTEAGFNFSIEELKMEKGACLIQIKGLGK